MAVRVTNYYAVDCPFSEFVAGTLASCDGKTLKVEVNRIADRQ